MVLLRCLSLPQKTENQKTETASISAAPLRGNFKVLLPGLIDVPARVPHKHGLDLGVVEQVELPFINDKEVGVDVLQAGPWPGRRRSNRRIGADSAWRPAEIHSGWPREAK